ncbi:type VI secretion system contractile sheath small subunit [Vibrio sp. S4M6]|uniref:type VI secretion system contractile sheath small subunit n=1 Tax=Vibrio sinus TaxID=2946865 RepID=UPI00202A51DF|nr:type VI secretion system contractile sheath small subunit [Vibrio sinus]MCL9781019.1 type VI secretion system contractile sheath small subunit [Vibrio sinus]
MAINKKLPKSRLMIQYDTRVEGEKKKKELPYRTMVLGDFSAGKSKDAQVPFEEREVRTLKHGINSSLKDMGISLDIAVPNSINPSKSPMLNLKFDLNSMKDFKPENLAKKIPEINALLQLKEMLSSFEKDIDNNRTLKKTIDNIFSDKVQLQALRESIPQLDNYSLLKKTEGVIESEAETNNHDDSIEQKDSDSNEA